jgi:hypothetical protein
MDLVSYFQSYENYFWEWVTDKDVRDLSGYLENNLVSVPNVGAIAYRPYIIEVLKNCSRRAFRLSELFFYDVRNTGRIS